MPRILALFDLLYYTDRGADVAVNTAHDRYALVESLALLLECSWSEVRKSRIAFFRVSPV
jgi:hypothetical protein